MHIFAQKSKTTQQAKSAKSTKPNRSLSGQSPAASPTLNIQCAIGNQAAGQLLQTNSDDRGVDSIGSSSLRFAHNSSQMPLHANSPPKIQKKPTIGSQGDTYEQEADRVAEQVLQTPEWQPERQHTCACGGACSKCQREQLNQEHKYLQTKRGDSNNPQQTPVSILDRGVLPSVNQPLDPETRAFMESRFRRDFSPVRVYFDSKAAESAHALNARAYTWKHHIVFGHGQYAPKTPEGQLLLAHELSHVIQQTQSRRLPTAAQTESIISPIHTLLVAPPHIARSPRSRPAPRRPRLPSPSSTLFFEQQPGSRPEQEPSLVTAGCDTSQSSTIQSAVPEAERRVTQTIGALTTFAQAPSGPPSIARQALAFTFKDTNPAVANHVRARFMETREVLRDLMRGTPSSGTGSTAATPAPRLECHDATTDRNCQGIVAYIPALRPGQTARESMIFCPTFYGRRDRSGIVVHEVLHTLVSGEHIGDRSYSHTRFYPELTTEEALTNADSYRIFMQHITSGQVPEVGRQLVDSLSGCNADQSRMVDQALTRIERWLSVAQRVMMDRRQEWLDLQYWRDLRQRYLGGLDIGRIDNVNRRYENIQGTLDFMVFAHCHSQADATCPTGTPTATSPGALAPEVHACPDWFAEPRADERAILFFAEMLRGTGVAARSQQLNLARMAVELYNDLGQAPSLDEILGRPPRGDFPVPDPRRATRRA